MYVNGNHYNSISPSAPRGRVPILSRTDRASPGTREQQVIDQVLPQPICDTSVIGSGRMTNEIDLQRALRLSDEHSRLEQARLASLIV